MFITFSKERNISIMRLVTFIISTILGSQLSRVPGVQARRNSLVGRRGAGGRGQEADRWPPGQPQVGGLGGGRHPGHLEAAGGQGHLPAPPGGLNAPASEAGRRVSDGRLGLSQLSRGRQNKVMICRNKLLPSHLVGRLKNIIIIFANLNFLTCYI